MSDTYVPVEWLYLTAFIASIVLTMMLIALRQFKRRLHWTQMQLHNALNAHPNVHSRLEELRDRIRVLKTRIHSAALAIQHGKHEKAAEILKVEVLKPH